MQSHLSLQEGDREMADRSEGHMITRQRLEWCNHKSWNVGSHWLLGEAKNRFFSESQWRDSGLSDNLILTHWGWFQIFSFHNYDRMHFSCFKFVVISYGRPKGQQQQLKYIATEPTSIASTATHHHKMQSLVMAEVCVIPLLSQYWQVTSLKFSILKPKEILPILSTI